MSNELGVGIVGCGNISEAYMHLGPLFSDLKILACADINREAARAMADKHGLRADTVSELLVANDLDIIVNLTIPDVHFAVSRDILNAGKHVYSEKPLALTTADGLALKALADKKNLRVGCAPDTFLGGAHQLARRTVDNGDVGKIIAGTCHVMNHGMEHWHPNPDFFYKVGGGPVLDIGPYYVANLINLIGPVARVGALTNATSPTRTITSEPRSGETIPVDTPTNIHALLEFKVGALVTLSASWDVWAHRHKPMELYGTEGSLYVPDPNFFGGEVLATRRGDEAEPVATWDHPFSIPNQEHASGKLANYRTAGLADMARAIGQGRDHRCSLDRTLHGLEVMTAILQSGEEKRFVDLQTTCERPAALGIEEARSLLR